MRYSRLAAAAAAALAFATAGAARADITTPDPFCAQAQAAPMVTTHTTTIAGAPVAYTATVGFLHVTAADGASHACVFYTAYKRTDVGAAATRPLGFAFNGGPGSASLWLHLGALGPKRVDLGPLGLAPPQPFALLDNDSSFLDVMDLVMIDPVATGFSKADPGSSADKFFGVKNDYQSIANFVQSYLTQEDRWASPKFIVGESYGGIRASLLTNYLQRSLGINIAGVIFVSPFMATTSDDLFYVSFLPTYATTAWYYHRSGGGLAGKSLAEVRAAAEAFAFGPYLDALALGSDLPDDQAKAIAQQLADLTGLPLQYVLDNDMRITDTDFFAALLADDHKMVGRYDARYSEGTTGNPTEDSIDPADQALSPPFTAAINDYLINDLDFKSSNPYVTMGAVGPWPYNSDASEFNVMDQLSGAMLDNPQLKVYVAAGYYDLAVPYGATIYNFRHLAPNQSLAKRVTMGFFDAGHMVYTNPSCLVDFKAGVRAFVADVLAPQVPVSH